MSYPFDDSRVSEWAMGMAKHMAKLSKDPSTQVGAVIFDDKRRLISGGYNGLPRGVIDMPGRLSDRTVKYRMTLHAEMNAMAFATAPLDGATLFCTHPCCAQCSAMVIQRGISHVWWPTPSPEFLDRWGADLKLSTMMFQEAGVHVHEL